MNAKSHRKTLKTFAGLPDHYFDDKNALNYSFFIQDDIAKAAGEKPAPYDDALHRDHIRSFYADGSETAIYVQIPWCEFRCTYCYYFRGLYHNDESARRLIRAEKEHAVLLDEEIGLDGKHVNSIYFGGGTPTILREELLDEILSFFVNRYAHPHSEICCESSLSTLTPAKLDILQKYVTRLSIGIQSFNNRLLRLVERRFTATQAEDLLRDIVPRFPNVNIDLIYGLQSQSMEDWLDSVRKAIELEVPSVTVYRLELRHEVPMVKAFRKRPEEFPNEVETQGMYLLAKEMFLDAGYVENLVGWFLLPKVPDTVVYRERWEKQTPCVAFGPDVHNYGENHFYDNFQEIDAYVSAVEHGALPVRHFYTMTLKQRLMWYMVSQWKSNSPIYRPVMAARYGEDQVNWFLGLIKNYVDWNALRITNDKVELTDCGTAILEWILRDTIDKAFGK